MSRSSRRRDVAKKTELKNVLRRTLGVETLERRSVLCAIVCSLNDGTLDVGVGEGEDTVSVQVDQDSQTVQIRDAGQVVQSFAAGAVQNLNVRSLSGSGPLPAERIQVDPAISIPVQVNPVAQNTANPSSEAENAIASQDSKLSALAPASAAFVQPVINTSFFIPLPTAAQAQEDHSAHYASLSAPLSFSGFASSTSDAGHDHGPMTSATSTISSVDSSSYGTTGSALIARTMSRDTGSGEHHSTYSSTKKEQDWGSSDLAPKFCLTTPYTKTLIANVDRKAECSCTEKQKVSSDNHDLLAGMKGDPTRVLIDVSSAWKGSSRTCRPSENEFRAGLITDLDICAERSVDQVIRDITGEVDPREQASRLLIDGNFADQSAQEASAFPFSIDNWSQQLRVLGWVMMAAGAAVLPAMLLQNEEEDEDEESYWGRGGFELLNA